MAEATLLEKIEIGTSGLMKYVFDVVGLSTNTVSPENEFDFEESIFTILGLNFACSSTNVNLTLFDESGVSTPSVHQILNQSGINQSFSDNDVGLVVYAATESLYGIIGNKDITNHTGSISIAFLVR